VFLDPELGRSAAELGPAEKHARSHRGRALAALLDALAEAPGGVHPPPMHRA
jgi:XTP/dITP diphosphohydrolase